MIEMMQFESCIFPGMIIFRDIFRLSPFLYFLFYRLGHLPLMLVPEFVEINDVIGKSQMERQTPKSKGTNRQNDL